MRHIVSQNNESDTETSQVDFVGVALDAGVSVGVPVAVAQMSDSVLFGAAAFAAIALTTDLVGGTFLKRAGISHPRLEGGEVKMWKPVEGESYLYSWEIKK
jgi:hypothetical protein